MKKTKQYRHIKCDLCGEYLNSPLDLVIYIYENGKIVEVEFRHQSRCDDRRFWLSRHVKEGFEDLLEVREYLDKEKHKFDYKETDENEE